MNTLYRGLWPQVVGKLAKYAIRFDEGEWKISVWYDAGGGLRYLAVEGDDADLVLRINKLKEEFNGSPGGAFYINEYRHVLVPVDGTSESGTSVHYYYAGRYERDFCFGFEGRKLTTQPVDLDGNQLVPGSRWIGPRPGIPYVLAAGGGDIYFETPALTDDDPPSIRQRMIRKVQLSKILRDRTLLKRALSPVYDVRGHQGGRFYVNEHGAIFTPVGANDGNGNDYIYCGTIDREAWFPEPPVPF